MPRKLVGILLLLFAFSFASSMTVPVTSIYLTDELGGSASAAAAYFAAAALVGIVVTTFVGRASDAAFSRRKIVVVTAIWLAIGTVGISRAPNADVAIAFSAIFCCVFAVPASQLFAVAREITTAEEVNGISKLRLGYVGGWIIGPLVGGLFNATELGGRAVFEIQAAGYAVFALAAFAVLKAERPVASAKIRTSLLATLRQSPLLMKLSAAIALLLAGDISRIALLPIAMSERIGASNEEIGIAVSILPFVELGAILICTKIAQLWGEKLPLVLGGVAAVAYFFGLGLAGSVWEIYLLQSVYAFVPASLLGVAITFAQSLAPKHVGLSTSMVFAAQQVAVVLGSLIAVIAASILPLAGAFTLPGILSLLGAILLTTLPGFQRSREDGMV